ncbi:MAG: hypothetical protein D3911_07065 [Candidatus Electrothrix sp. AW3_4]|nr:hypothetical protein [Candidatus Electrothrix gigas]
MNRFIFSGINDFFSAFKKQPLPEDHMVKKAIDIIQASSNTDAGLGFHKIKTSTDELETVAQLLNEHGAILDSPQFDKLISYLHENEAKAERRRLFGLQLVISIVLLLGLFGLLIYRPNLSENTEKGIFSLLGVIVGFWLK